MFDAWLNRIEWRQNIILLRISGGAMISSEYVYYIFVIPEGEP